MVKKNKEPSEVKSSALDIAKAAIKKQFGADAVQQGKNQIEGIEFLSSGCLSLDRALGGGYPKGRIVEIFGPESSGKSTLCLHAVAQAQKEGMNVAYIDMEHAVDPKYSAALGINMTDLIIAQPGSGEEALGIADTLIKSGEVGLVIVDSVAALVPLKELEGDIGDASMGLQARMMGQALRMMSPIISSTNTIVIFVNQIRMKIGVVYGNPETTSGGNALKFYTSQRLEIRKKGTVKEGEEIVANETGVKVIKNKVAPPFRTSQFLIEYGKGIDKSMDLVRLAVQDGIVDKAGSWYSYKGEKIGQGEKRVKLHLAANPDLLKEITDLVANGTFDEETGEVF